MPIRLAQLAALVRSRRSSDAAYGRFWVIASAVIFGVMAVATRDVSAELGVGQIAVVRFALGLAGVAAIAAWRPRLLRGVKPVGLAARGILGGAAVLWYFTAIHDLSAGLGTLLNYTFPLWSAVFAALFLGESVGAWTALGMGVATCGMVVVVGPAQIGEVLHGAGGSAVRIGLLAGIGSSICGGAATTVVRYLRRTESALAIFGAFCAGGVVVSLPSALRDWRPVSPRAAFLLALIATLSFGGQMLYTYALKYVTAGAGSLAIQLTVVTSYALAAVTLGEPVSVNTLLGGLLVMGGVAAVSRGNQVPAPVTAAVE